MKDFLHLDVRRRSWNPARIIDVTLRDGGFRTGFEWSFEDVVTIATSALSAGAACVELGYAGGVPDMHGLPNPGLSADLSPDHVARVRERVGAGLLCAMVHPSAAKAVAPLAEYRSAGLDMVRLVYHEAWAARFFELAGEAAAAGLTTSANIALASRYDTAEFLEQVERVTRTGVDIVYFADTCAALFPERVEELTRLLTGLAPTGFHAHDFLSLALANSLVATSAGAGWIDASICGIGRGAGNLRLELWLAVEMACTGSGARLSTLAPALQLIEDRLGVQTAPDLVSIVAGALNLTPPQEDQVRVRAAAGSILEAAATLLENHGGAESVPRAFEIASAQNV